MKEYTKPQFSVVELCQNDKLAAEGGTIVVSSTPWWPQG